MPLISRQSFPPNGFFYREPKTGWTPKTKLLGFWDVVDALQTHRSQNKRLFTSDEASREQCAADLDAYTCHRLDNNPRWCAPSTVQERYQPSEDEQRIKKKASGKGCPSCGRSKKSL